MQDAAASPALEKLRAATGATALPPPQPPPPRHCAPHAAAAASWTLSRDVLRPNAAPLLQDSPQNLAADAETRPDAQRSMADRIQSIAAHQQAKLQAWNQADGGARAYVAAAMRHGGEGVPGMSMSASETHDKSWNHTSLLDRSARQRGERDAAAMVPSNCSLAESRTAVAAAQARAAASAVQATCWAMSEASRPAVRRDFSARKLNSINWLALPACRK